jgi:hypothetical protein
MNLFMKQYTWRGKYVFFFSYIDMISQFNFSHENFDKYIRTYKNNIIKFNINK